MVMSSLADHTIGSRDLENNCSLDDPLGRSLDTTLDLAVRLKSGKVR